MFSFRSRAQRTANVRLALSLTAAALDGLFDHPALNMVETTIPHSQPWIARDEIQAAMEVLRSGRIAQGPSVEGFERAVAGYGGRRGGVAVTSGTAALELALRALRIGPGHEVILPSYVCAAPWLAIQHVGAHARLVDIEPETFNIDPQQVREAISPQTRAIIVPHLFGLPADLTALQALGVPLIEDCAQTLGALEHGRPVGTVGTLTVCSFYATKLLCTGEGGMVLSDDESLLDRVRALRQYDEETAFDPAASNYKMTDLQAAIGLCQLNRLPSFLTRRQEIAKVYRAALTETSLGLPLVPPGRTHVYYRFVVQVGLSVLSNGGMQALITRLERAGVHGRRPVFQPLHRYLQCDGYPHSESAYQRALSIPLYPSLTDEAMARVVTVLRNELV